MRALYNSFTNVSGKIRTEKIYQPVPVPEGIDPVCIYSLPLSFTYTPLTNNDNRTLFISTAHLHKTNLTNDSTTSRLNSSLHFSNPQFRARTRSYLSPRPSILSACTIISGNMPECHLPFFPSTSPSLSSPSLSFTCVDMMEIRYSTNQDISRARQAFFKGTKSFLLVSERFHFYKRFTFFSFVYLLI